MKNPDLDRVEQEVQQADTVPAITPDVLSDLDKDEIERLKDRAKKLVEKNSRIAKAFYSMVASLRVYNVALAAINDECLKESLAGYSDAVVEILKNSVRALGMKEFTRHELSQHVSQHVLEFMAMELVLESDRDQKAAKSRQESMDALRRQLPVRVGCALHDEESLSLQRDRTVFLVGDPDVMRQLTDQITQTAVDSGHVTVRLLSTLKKSKQLVTKQENRNLFLVELGSNHWINCANSRRRLIENVGKTLHRTRGNKLDLLLVEDINQAKDASSPIPVHIRAHDAHRNLRQFVNGASSGLICCLPTRDSIDISGKEWEKLEIYADLRFLSTDAEGNVVLTDRDGKSWPAVRSQEESTDVISLVP